MQINVRMTVTDRGALSTGIRQRITNFESAVKAARVSAADTATRVSRANVRRIRPGAPPRANRYTGLKDAVRWRPIGSGDGVGLALQELNQKFPPWLVQEIGTGQKAVQHVGGSPNPVGRPTSGANYVKTVRSQVGRRISPGLVWAQEGKYVPPISARVGQGQLVPRSLAHGAPIRFDRATRRSEPGIRISREIHGQHFIKKGGEAGFREYRESVLAAARSQLKKRRTA